jgi:BirA family transcriptional regulator, biotin operon repressor / biotin---[acetyl-CoA-carboxylase] ligase
LIRKVPETGSTNADLLAALRAGDNLAEGLWLVADRQTAGRGRQGRAWFDGAGNFMGSTVVRLTSGEPPPASLALAAGLAVYAAVRTLLPEPGPLQLKWPNDLVYGGAKLAGMLLEREGDALVVGIGVNLAQAPTIPGRATTALVHLGCATSRDAFAEGLAAAFAAELARWRSFGLEPVLRRWRAAAHPEGTPLTVTAPGEAAVTGVFAGLTDDGALRLRLADGGVRVIHAGDVFCAREPGNGKG